MKKKQAQQQPNKAKAAPLTMEKKTNINLWLLSIIAITGLLYSTCLHNDILNFDDSEYFNVYPEVRDLSWASVKKIFTSYYLIMYQPLPVLTFAINYAISATDPVPLHLLNVIFHLSNIALVYYFIKQLTEKQNIAIIVAVLFAIHPMNIEAVSWISARSSGMYTFFYIASLISYIKYCKEGLATRHYILAILFFVISLFSKAQAVTLSVVLFAIDYYYARKLNSRLIIEKIPFLALSVAFGLITLSDPATQKNITNGMMISYTTIDMLFMVCYSFMFYFFKLFLPIDLCGIYVYPPKVDDTLPWEYYISPLFFLAIIYMLYRFRKNRAVIFGAALFFITISINIQIIPSRLFITTDRYAYFPYIGLFFIAGYYYNAIKEGIIQAKENAAGIFVLVVGAFSLFSAYTITERNKTWSNDLDFMTDIIEKNARVPYVSRAYGNRGNYYLNNNMPNEAIADFTEAIKIKPDDAQSYYNLAISYTRINDFQTALRFLDSAKKLKPDGALIYSNIGFVKFSLKDPQGALEATTKCIQLDSNIAEAYNIRAAVYFSRREFDAAEKDLNKSISLKPNYADAITNRGLLYLSTNRKGPACDDFMRAAGLGDSKASNLMNTNCK